MAVRRISQLLGVMGAMNAETKRRWEQLTAAAFRPELFAGRTETYEPKAVDGIQVPQQVQQVQLTADAVLEMARKLMTPQWNLMRTLDEGNTLAHADVVVDGTVLLENVPSTHLHWLTRELGKLLTLIEALPELDPSRRWEPSDVPGLSQNPPVVKSKTDKKPYRFMAVPAVKDKDPVYETLFHDEAVGEWTIVNFSGAIGIDRKRQLVDRVTRLRDAVKAAREEANSATRVEEVREAHVIFEYINGAAAA